MRRHRRPHCPAAFQRVLDAAASSVMPKKSITDTSRDFAMRSRPFIYGRKTEVLISGPRPTSSLTSFGATMKPAPYSCTPGEDKPEFAQRNRRVKVRAGRKVCVDALDEASGDLDTLFAVPRERRPCRGCDDGAGRTRVSAASSSASSVSLSGRGRGIVRVPQKFRRKSGAPTLLIHIQCVNTSE
jgi:hypothetical protein